MVTEHGICDHDLRKGIRVFTMIKLLAIVQVKGSKTVMKELYSAR